MCQLFFLSFFFFFPALRTRCLLSVLQRVRSRFPASNARNRVCHPGFATIYFSGTQAVNLALGLPATCVHPNTQTYGGALIRDPHARRQPPEDSVKSGAHSTVHLGKQLRFPRKDIGPISETRWDVPGYVVVHVVRVGEIFPPPFVQPTLAAPSGSFTVANEAKEEPQSTDHMYHHRDVLVLGDIHFRHSPE
jgi:hypothetical protein